ncbi:hypothetical protein ID866_8663 [Astraeus odoratus]|nr:hypothetical protein ID866_8663 [Astraeus odoratus]
MKEFMFEGVSTPMLHERIHTIWFCIPMNDHPWLITSMEVKFFSECDTRGVPVIVLFTKADILHIIAIANLRDEGYHMGEAKARAADVAKQLETDLQESVSGELNQYKFAPKAYLSLERVNEKRSNNQLTKLITCTADALDNDFLQKLLISTQQANLAINIRQALQREV